jgi:dTMP kinase
MYVILEGIDTSGKSTQIELLKYFLPKESNLVPYFTCEPSITDVGMRIRDIIKEKDMSYTTEMFLFLSDRAEHFSRMIEPFEDQLVISDRGLVSGIAYALTNDLRLNLEHLVAMNLQAIKYKYPDLIVFLELKEETLRTRLGSKTLDKIENRGIEYLLEVQENMRRTLHFMRHFKTKFLTINASLDKNLIHEKIKEAILSL